MKTLQESKAEKENEKEKKRKEKKRKEMKIRSMRVSPVELFLVGSYFLYDNGLPFPVFPLTN